MVSRIKQGSMSVPDYEGFFLSHRIMKKYNEQYLIQIALDGLKKEIRDGLESTQFPTLGSLFQEAAVVEDILEEEKSLQNSPRRRKRKRRPKRFVDPEDEWIWDGTGDSAGVECDDDWSYLGETTIDISDDGSDDKTRMSEGFSSPDGETDHGSDENNPDASGAGEADSYPDASGSVADPSPSVAVPVTDSSASVVDPSPSGPGSVADSSAAVSASVDDSSASFAVK